MPALLIQLVKLDEPWGGGHILAGLGLGFRVRSFRFLYLAD